MNTLVPLYYQNGTDSRIKWDELAHKDHQLLVAVIFENSPEEARKKLSISHSTFYRKWGRLKGYYNELIKDFPRKASEILLSQSIKAAQELGKELDSDNEQIRQKAATQILDRTLAKEVVGLKRRITLEDFEEKEEREGVGMGICFP